ncbi:MAG: ribonuclease D [Rickettsiales bacterium]|nr:ribonuclease D [Rickettsiales bacterium]
MTDFQFIDNNQDLEDISAQIKNADFITLDTEFVRDFSYIPQIGLIQIGYQDKIYLFDAIKCDLTPLIEIFTDEKIVKIIHSANQDCDVLYKNFQIIPKPIFDTQIASSIMGIGDNISYQKLVKRFAHKTLEKDTKLTNWSERPLLAKQLKYAANDVKYLAAIKIKLEKLLKESGRDELMQDETNLLYDLTQYNNSPLNCWKRISTVNKTPYFLNYLRQYAAIREEICREKDKLKRNVISDDLLTELAKLQPSCELDIKQHRLLAHRLNKNLWQRFIDVSKQIKDSGESEIPSQKKYILNQNQEVIYNFLKLLLNYVSAQHSISPRIIATTDELKKFIKTEEDTRFMQNKRYEIFGQYARKLIDGKLSFSVKKGELKITES